MASAHSPRRIVVVATIAVAVAVVALAADYQRDTAVEVAARHTVEMPKTRAAGEIAGLALDGAELEPATLTYRVTMEAGGQSIDLDSTVSWSRATYADQDVWRVATTIDSPMVKASDIAFLAVEDLRPLHRMIEQGPLQVLLDFADAGITGTMVVPGGNTTDVDVALEGPVVGHLDTAIALMPLAPGFETDVQVFEINMPGARRMNIVVVATESIETPAGSFETYRLELDGGEGWSATTWVTKVKPHRSVKSHAALPAASGRMVTVLTAVE